MQSFSIIHALSAAAPAAAADTTVKIEVGLVLAVVGMGVVFLALTVIGFMMYVISKLLRDRPAPQVIITQAPAPAPAPAAVPVASAPVAAPVAPAPVAVPVDLNELPTTTLLLLTAAVAATVRQPARISRVHFLQDSNAGSAWAELGRVAIQKSHSIRKSNR